MKRLIASSCLVIGGGGFVGSALVAEAAEFGCDVSIAGRDDYASFVGRSFDVVIHANGNALRYRAAEDPARDFDANVRSVLRSLFDFSYRRYALVSTVDVYPDPSRREGTSEASPIDPIRLSPYGFHKRLAELCVERYAHDFQIFRLAQMVGPGLRKGPIFDLVHGQSLRIDPASRLQFLSTQTVARVLWRLIAEGPPNQVYNVCGRGSVSLRRVAGLLPVPVAEAAMPAGDVQRYLVDTSKTHAACGLPTSWDEVRAFLGQPTPRGAVERGAHG